ncbi:MAG: hypothetical protein JW712_02740, partial [Dehalococcoidales bacterium]|nr:hypothetical protein [Dehalococcoidales bacterium]
VQDKAIAAIYIDVTTTPPQPQLDVIFDGDVYLAPGETVDVTAVYKVPSGTVYTINQTTPLGALDAASKIGDGFSCNISDKKFTDPRWILMLDGVDEYIHGEAGDWYAYVNDRYIDGYAFPADGLNVLEVADGDSVDYYYSTGENGANLTDVQDNAIAAIFIDVTTTPQMDVLFDGIVNLTPGATVNVTATWINAEGTEYTINQTTPLGALNAAAIAGGFDYVLSDKKMTTTGILLLDDVAQYTYNNPGKWYAYVGDRYIDGFTDPADGLNVLEVYHGQVVDYFYAEDPADETDRVAVKEIATAAVHTVVNTGVRPETWTLQLAGAKQESITRVEFEAGVACTHSVTWTDEYSDNWTGIPLWVLVGMIDDDPDVGPDHYNFNDTLAAQGYSVTVIAGDGWDTTLSSQDIARNDGYIVANMLNGEQLPLETTSGKPCWPLYLKGSEVFGGQQVGNIVRIELTGMPEPDQGWTLKLVGEVGDKISQAEFENGLACTQSGHYVEWTDASTNVWSGVPLWVLAGVIDDIEDSAHWTFNDDVATAGYTVNVIAGDNYTKSFASADIQRSNNFIIANSINGTPLEGSTAPLRLVGDGVATDGVLKGSAVGNIVRIEIPELMTPEPAEGSWNLLLNGMITDVISEAEYEAAVTCSHHTINWTDANTNVWSGIPLYDLAGWVDDREPHNFNNNQAMAGYTVVVKAGDGYSKTFPSNDVAWNTDYIIADSINGTKLTGGSAPLRLVGDAVANAGALTGLSVGNIVEIALIDFNKVEAIPQLHIVKYGADGVTIVSETTVDYVWMQENLDVIGDGVTTYKFEGITQNPDDIWDEDETCPGGYKIENAVKGTRLSDLCDLVGGMGEGTDIRMIASDGYKTKLPYCAVYPDAENYTRQGDAIIAWWADGDPVPYYGDGMRLFFTPADTVYGQTDMRETLPGDYWHYYYDSISHTLYPSCAGISAKNIVTIEVYTIPQPGWTLVLDGVNIDGLHQEVSKNFFEQALACQFGAEHGQTYTDANTNVWGGMPLWFLAGYVDDQDLHSSSSFNDTKALAGYTVKITNTDGSSVNISSQDIIRNNDYIVANTCNGTVLSDSDPNWPLVLVGPGVTPEQKISHIARIDLISPGVTPGDANGDLSINVLDITKMIRIILEFDAVTPGADANGDGNVNVLDISWIVGVILELD